MQTATPPPLPTTFLQPPAISDHRHHLLIPTAASPTSIHQFKQLHANILRSGYDHSFPFFFSKLLSFPFSSPPSLNYILAVFLHSPNLDPRICHRALRTFSCAADGPRRALIAYACMRRSEVEVDRFMFPTLLRAAARVTGGDGVVVRREAHGLVLKLGFLSDPFIQTALAGAYAAGGMVGDAHGLVLKLGFLSDPFIQTALAGAYAAGGMVGDARKLFDRMLH